MICKQSVKPASRLYFVLVKLKCNFLFFFRKGTLVRNWAMRLEAKHNYFKKLATKVNNFNNITYSLSRRHQALQAHLLQSPPGQYLRISQELGPSEYF